MDEQIYIADISFAEQFLHENQDYEVCELICLGCRQRWIGAYPKRNLLKDMECQCGAKGLIVKTGQTIEVEDERN